MPIVKIEMGKATRELKKELIEKLTDTLSQTTNMPKQSFTIIINEESAENLGIGGVQLSEMKKSH